MPGKVDKDNTDDILKQFISDEEDEQQLGNAEEGNEDDKEDDDSSTESVAGDDNEEETDEERLQREDEEEDKEIKERLEQDKDGNLIKNGKVLVKAGKDRGIFEKLKKKLTVRETELTGVYKQLGEIAASAKDLMQRYKALQEERSYGQAIGLDKAEEKEAMETFAKFKVDPKGALRSVLTKMHLAGNDLTELGVSGPLDPEVVARHVLALQEKGKSATESVVTPPEEPHVKESREFLDRYPELKDPQNRPMLAAVADAKTKFPHLSLDECWIRIKTYVANKEKEAKAAAKQQTDPKNKVIPRNGSNVTHQPNKKGLDVSARATDKSFGDIGKELLADLKALEEM